MPLYEYRCRACDHVMEVLQKLSDRPVRKCESCGGKVEKLISRTSFSLKGGGWFDQGYGGGKKAGPTVKSEGATAEGASGSGDSGKGDSGKSGSGKSGSDKGGSGDGGTKGGGAVKAAGTSA